MLSLSQILTEIHTHTRTHKHTDLQPGQVGTRPIEGYFEYLFCPLFTDLDLNNNNNTVCLHNSLPVWVSHSTHTSLTVLVSSREHREAMNSTVCNVWTSHSLLGCK